MEIIPFNKTHLDEIAALEKECFVLPWSREMFEEELKSNLANYFIAVDNDRLVGYAGMWKILDEGHITNIAVAADHRRAGVGQALLDRLMRVADTLEISTLLLEVRASNTAAHRFYAKNGFVDVGRRKGYYSDNGEDAVLMTLQRNE